MALVALYLLGQIDKSRMRAEGLQIIDEAFREMVEEVNQFYRERGLSGMLAPESSQLRKRWAEIVAEFDTLLNTDDPYWKSEEGQKRGMGLLALFAVYSASSAITVSVAKKTPDVKLVWKTMEDPEVCPACEKLEGEEFNPSDELPPQPLHPGCRCWFVIVFG